MTEENIPNDFTSRVPPPDKEVVDKIKQEQVEKQETIDKSKQRVADINESVLTAQEKVYKGLADTMSNITLENMQKLAPEDNFDIEINGKPKTFQRIKLKPKMIKELRQAQRKYNEDVKNIDTSDPDSDDLKIDREQQLLAYKANLYLGMTDEEFEECDIEYLSQVIQATELRTQGFRKC